MRTANYIFSTVSLVLGLALILFVMTQADEFRLRSAIWPPDWSIGTVIGVILVLNGAIRLWFAQDEKDGDPTEPAESI